MAQHRLLTEELGVESVRLVSSWSMGACQTYAWAALHPEMVQAIAPISGSARTANFNKVFLAGNIRAITSDPDWNDGFYGDKPPVRGVKAMAAPYAGWGFSEPFDRQEVFRSFGATTVEEFIDYFWNAFFLKRDANDLIASVRRVGRAAGEGIQVLRADSPLRRGGVGEQVLRGQVHRAGAGPSEDAQSPAVPTAPSRAPGEQLRQILRAAGIRGRPLRAAREHRRAPAT